MTRGAEGPDHLLGLCSSAGVQSGAESVVLCLSPDQGPVVAASLQPGLSNSPGEDLTFSRRSEVVQFCGVCFSCVSIVSQVAEGRECLEGGVDREAPS